MENSGAELVVGAGALACMFWFLFFGWLSDRVGRKKPIVAGYIATLLLLFPLFHLMGDAANPNLAEAARRAPIIVSGNDCTYNPFAKEQLTECGRLLHKLSTRGLSYLTKEGKAGSGRSEEHTSELQSLMRISYAVSCLIKKNTHYTHIH